jgi:hypothetical protein
MRARAAEQRVVGEDNQRRARRRRGAYLLGTLRQFCRNVRAAVPLSQRDFRIYN